MIIIFAVLAIIAAILTTYFVVKSREFRKFLAGAFFVSGGIQLYFWLADISIPLLGTDFIQTPEISAIRCIPHFVFSLLCFYFGFMKKSRKQPMLNAE